ncbi:hypothetical protein MMB232_03045 [Brevundimonas subvibrioides]|uniref:S41 family peptidase n=1 Tax=Brevundimonas subvibrioides TaxID=74313 RepID=UPI0032D56ADD
MLSRRRLLQISAGLALSAATPAYARPSVSEDWSGDIEILRQAWQAMHPGLYRYSSPDEITARLEGLSAAWKTPGSFRDRFLTLTRVTASVRCGHTYPSPYNGGAAVRDRLYPGRELLPFRYVWIDGRMVVTEDQSAEGLFPLGTGIAAIDGVATPDILSRLIPLARADGHNDAKRISLMAVRGDGAYETADIHLPLVLPGLVDRASFTLADARTVTAALLTLAGRQAKSPSAVQPTGDANPWTLDKGADGVARLTMPGWALYNSTFDWQTWLGGVMDDLTGDGARGLIVDLRGNEGGEDCGNVILTRLVDRDFAPSRSQRFVRYRRAPEALDPYLDTWDRSFLDWGDQAVADSERPGFYRLTRYDDGEAATLIRPAGRRFAGPVAVLCDASNSSATFSFAQSVQESRTATLIGTPTGGNRRGINGGAFCFLRLPASRIEVDLPLIASFPEAPQPDAGIEPDLHVPTTAADIAAGTDPQMAAATARILSA